MAISKLPSFKDVVKNVKASAHKAFWHSPVGQKLVDTQKYMESGRPIELPRVSNTVNNMVRVPVGPVQIKPIGMARDILNEPFKWTTGTLSDASVNVGRTLGGRQLSQY